MELTSASAERRNFHTLDALRGVAAAAVFLRHARDFAGAALFPSSQLAVDLFFLLSGFVICHAYERRLAAGMTARDFMIVRLIRLYPLYILGTLCGVAVVLAGLALHKTSVWSPTDLLSASAFGVVILPCPTMPEIGNLFPLDTAAWSLFWELVVNLLYAFTWRWTRSPFALAAILALSAAGMVAASIHFGSTDLGTGWRGWLGAIPRVGFSFFAGVAAYRVFARLHPIRWRLPVLVLVALPVAAFLLPVGAIVPQLLCVALVFPPLVLLAASGEPPLVLKRACAFLGATSYALYILQAPLLLMLEQADQKLLRSALEGAAPLTIVILLPGFLCIAAVADRWFDLPVRRRLTRLRATPQFAL